LWKYLQNGGKRALAIWHRRYGKDEIALHWTGHAAHKRIGTYWHMLPEAAQARKAIWEAIDPKYGIRRIDVAFPKELREQTRESDMFIRFKSGSTWQVVGSDNYNSLVGSPPIGIVFSEWAIANPTSWAYLRPILRENGGWALFITTSRGNNHAKKMFVGGADDPEWYTDMQRADQTGIFTEHELAQELREYIREYGRDLGTALYNQEYMCSFEGATLGAIYGKEMQSALEDGRITSVPYDPSYPVHTSCDLGAKDSTVFIFWQRIGHKINVIDCEAFVHTLMSDMIKVLKDKPYQYGQMIAPHDVNVFELGAGIRKQEAARLGVNFEVAPNLGKGAANERINSFRGMLSRCWFDSDKCETLVDALGQYSYEWDQTKRALSRTPKHDWTSDYADAAGYYAITPQDDGWGGDLDYSAMDVA